MRIRTRSVARFRNASYLPSVTNKLVLFEIRVFIHRTESGVEYEIIMTMVNGDKVNESLGGNEKRV